MDEISHPTFTFYERRVERSSLPRQHVVLYLLFPPTLTREWSRRKDPGGKHVLYIRGGSAYFVYPLFIVGSLPLFFCYVLPAPPRLLATHRPPFPFPSSFSLPLFRSGLIRVHIRRGNRVPIVYRITIVYRLARDARKSIERFYGRDLTSRRLWKRFHLAAAAVTMARGSTARKGRIKRTIDRPFSRLSHGYLGNAFELFMPGELSLDGEIFLSPCAPPREPCEDTTMETKLSCWSLLTKTADKLVLFVCEPLTEGLRALALYIINFYEHLRNFLLPLETREKFRHLALITYGHFKSTIPCRFVDLCSETTPFFFFSPLTKTRLMSNNRIMILVSNFISH